MEINIKIPEKFAKSLSPDAQSALTKYAKNYSIEVIKEANLIEQGLSINGDGKEVTKSMIDLAAQKRKLPKKKLSIKGIIIKAAAAFSALLTGFFCDIEKLQNSKCALILFFILLIATCISNMILFVYEEKED